MEQALLSAIHPLRILVVDDALAFCKAAGQGLSRLGAEGIPAQTAEDASRCVRVFTPESALVDLRLQAPDVDGVCVAREIKGILPRLPVILISGFDLATIMSRDSGGVVEQVFSKVDVGHALRSVVSRARHRRATVPWIALDAFLEAIRARRQRADNYTRNVLSKVCLDLTRDWSLPALCHAAGGIGRRQLARVFKESLGIPPREFVVRLRVEAAKIYLRNPDLSQDAIARKTGLGNERNLHRVFKRVEGCAPGEFRGR